MAVGKMGRSQGSVGKAGKKTGPIGKGGRKRGHGTKFMTTFTGAKVQYPTTTTTV
jgi:hypothetical protein